MKKYTKKAFTLVELMIVIAIIGVLASLLFPALSGAMGARDKLKATNNAKGIVDMWVTSKDMIVGRNVYEWAGMLSKKTGLDDPKLWLLDIDSRVQEKLSSGASMPVSIVDEYQDFCSFPVSWEVANRLQKSEQTGTPLLWSRGLKFDGTWDADMGVFQDKGGIIGFTDGRVTWFDVSLLDQNNKGLLKKYGTHKRTHNIAEAVKGGAANILRGALDDID